VNRGVALALAIALALALASGLAACGDAGPHAPDEHVAAVVTPAPDDPQACVYAAVLVPRQTLEVRAPGPGEIVELSVAMGDVVQSDAPLVTVHDPELEHDLAEAHAMLDQSRARRRRAEAELELRRRDAASDEALARGGYLGGSELAKADLAARTAAHDRSAARAAEIAASGTMQRLGDRRHQHVVRAPWPARVAARLVDLGARVERGTPLVRLVDDATPRLRFGVAPEAAADFSPGTIVRARIEGVGDVDARVAFVGSVQDLGTLVVSVDAELLDAHGRVGAGVGAWVWRSGRDTDCRLPAVSVAARAE